jgi:hypothetical protein
MVFRNCGAQAGPDRRTCRSRYFFYGRRNVDADRLPIGIVALYYLGRGYMDYRLAQLFFPEHLDRIAALRWVYHWANPLADLLDPFIVYAALLSNTVRWRGINYQIKEGRVVRL